MMTCRELIDFLMGYLDGELPREERDRFEAHLAACPECVAYVDTYRQTRDLAASLCDDDDIPSDVPDDLVRAILDSRRGTD